MGKMSGRRTLEARFADFEATIAQTSNEGISTCGMIIGNWNSAKGATISSSKWTEQEGNGYSLDEPFEVAVSCF